MKKLTSSLIILPVLLAIQSSEAALDRISDFALLDSKGEFYQLSRYRHQKAMVIMALDGTCSETMDSLDQFESLRSKFGDQPITFLLLNSSDNLNFENTQTLSGIALDAHLPLLRDNGQLVSEAMSVTKSGEVVIVDPNALTLLYRGIGGEEASAVIKELLAGEVFQTETKIT